MAPVLDPHSLLDVSVRLHAELGRTRMPLGQAVVLPDGAIVDLDREPDAPVDVFVNGKFYGSGRLVVVDGEWALRLERVGDITEVPAPSGAATAGQLLAEVAAGTAATAVPFASAQASAVAAD